jgi:hypothetical protein
VRMRLVQAAEAEHLLVMLHEPADKVLPIVVDIDNKRSWNDSTRERWIGWFTSGSRMRQNQVLEFIILSNGKYRRLDCRVSTYHKRDEHRKATRAGGATACATMEKTVGVGEQMARTTTVALWSHVTCFCLAAREGMTVRNLKTCSSSLRRRGCVGIVLNAEGMLLTPWGDTFGCCRAALCFEPWG